MTTYTITWDKWTLIKPLGAVLGNPTIIPAPDPKPNEVGQPPEIIFPLLSATEEAMAELEKRNKPSRMQTLLKKMYTAASAKIGDAQREELTRGLRIELIVNIDGKLRLQLSRPGVRPSSQEWKIVTDSFPVPLAERMPEGFDYLGRGYLRAAWRAGNPSDPNP